MRSDTGPGLVQEGESDRDAARGGTPTPQQALLRMVAAALVLAMLHGALALAWPRLVAGSVPPRSGFTPSPLSPALNLALYVANLFVLGNVLIKGPLPRLRHVAAGLAGYVAIMWLLWPWLRVMTENLVLVVLAVMVFGGLLRHPYLLGYLYLFLLCQRFAPAYMYPAFLVTSLLYTTLHPFIRAWRQRRERFVPLCHVAGMILLTGLLIPIVFFCTQSSPQDILARWSEVEVLTALGVSLKTSAIAALVVVVLGVPLAYAMVRRTFPGRGLIDTMIDLPIVVPPPIAGITLLAFLGPKSPLGAMLESRLGLRLMDSEWAIVLAQLFVASPYLIRASMVAFSAVDVRYENVARTLGGSGLSVFLRVTLPMSVRGVLIGVVLTWFRAMAEFGSLRIMANRPRTIPILAYERFIDYRQMESQSVAVLVLLLSLSVIAGMWLIRSMPGILGRSIGVSDADR